MAAAKGRVVEEVIEVDPFTVVRFPDQPRKLTSFDPKWITKLANSMKTRGQREPVILTPYYGPPIPGVKHYLVNGENRCRAAQEAGIMLRAIVRKVKDKRDHKHESAVANFFVQQHTAMETAEVIKWFRDEEKMTWAQIEDEIGMTQMTIRKYYDLSLLDSSVQKLLEGDVPRADRLPISVASELSKLPPAEQTKLLNGGAIRKKSAALAIQIIRKRAQAVQAAGGSVVQAARGRKRVPSDDADIFKTHLKRAENEFNLLLGMIPDIKAAVRHRGIERNGETMQAITQLGNLASRLQKEVLAAMPENFRAAYVRKK